MMKNVFKSWLGALIALSNASAVGAFCVVGIGSITVRSSDLSISMSTPGSWDNDDFLESLGRGGGGGGAANSASQGDNISEEPGERAVPENDMTDEEITMMAMRAAQFYNTDTPMEEAYGVQKKGPPGKNDEEESVFQ